MGPPAVEAPELPPEDMSGWEGGEKTKEDGRC